MSGLLNIGGSVDPSYRYKMPRVQSKIEGRGNGIKTVIVNGEAVADSLHRPLSHLIKYFGCELGAQSKVDVKDNNKSIVNGAHENAIMQGLVATFVSKFVLCPTCNLPETSLSIKSKKGEIWHKCAACGSKHMLDMTHKLCALILKEAKNDSKKENEDDPDKKSKKERRDDRDARKEKLRAEKEKEDDKEKEKEKIIKKKAKEEKKRLKEESELEIGATKEALAVQATEEALAIEASWLRLREFLDGDSSLSSDAILEELTNLQLAGGFSGYTKILIFYMANVGKCDKPSSIKTECEKYSSVWKVLVDGEEMQEVLLACIERHIRTNFAMLKHTPVILKVFYDADILEEDAVLVWSSTRGRSEFTYAAVEDAAVAMIKSKAKPFVSWLQAADEDGEDGEEEEEDDDEEEEGEEEEEEEEED